MERKLTAILSADVKGYSRLMGDDEEATIRTLTAYREVMATLIQQHRGRVVDSPGDNLLAEFASVVEAVRGRWRFSTNSRSGMPSCRPTPHGVSYRHQRRRCSSRGRAALWGWSQHRSAFRRRSRTRRHLHFGDVHDHTENKLALEYEYIGEQSVKNIAKPVRVYRVVMEPVAAVSPGEGASRESKVESQTLALRIRIPQSGRAAVARQALIAVLPFTNLSGDPEQEYFSDGITEDLITDLSKLSGLFVIARNSAFTYKGKAVKSQR